MTGEGKLIALCKSAIEETDLQLERKRGISTTISHLKAFWHEAQEQDPADQAWNNKFFELWEILEITYAVAAANEQEWLDSEDIDRIDDALLEMCRMLQDKIARLERARGKSDDACEA